MRKAVMWLAATAAILGAGYYGLVAYPGERFRAELDRALLQLPAGYSATYQAVAYDPFARHAAISGIALRGDGKHRLALAIDRVELTNLNGDFAAAWSRAAANPAAVQQSAAIRVGGAIAVSGVSYTLGKVTATVAGARAERLDLHPWALLHANAPALSASLPFVFDRTDDPGPDEVIRLARAQVAPLLGVGFRRLVVDGVAIAANVPGGAGEPAQVVSQSIRRISVEHYTPGRIGEAVIEGIAVDLEGLGGGGIDRITMTGIDTLRPLGRILGGEPLSPTLFDGFNLGRFELTGLTVRVPDTPPATFRGLTLTNVAIAQGMPVSGGISLIGLYVSAKMIGERLGADAITLLDVDGLMADFSAAYDWDVATRRLALRDIVLDLDNLGRLEFSLDLAEIVPPEAKWENARLVQAKLRYVDASLATRALRAAGGIFGLEQAALRQQLIGIVRQQGMAIGVNPAVNAAVAAISDFIRSPGSLTVEIKPPASLALGGAQGSLNSRPGDFFASLGLRVTANQ